MLNLKKMLLGRALIPSSTIGFQKEFSFFISLGYSSGLLDRSLKQYACQRVKVSFYRKMCQELFSTFIVFIFLFLLAPLSLSAMMGRSKGIKSSAIVTIGVSDSLVPPEIRGGERVELKPSFRDLRLLELRDLVFLIDVLLSSKFKCFFFSKVLYKVLVYKKAFNYSPDMVLVSCEFSFTSSILTKFCEMYGVSHVNVAHGEKVLNVRDAFCSFHRMFVWDEWMKLICLKLRMECEFSIYNPHLGMVSSLVKESFIYYLQNESDSELKDICLRLKKLSEDGYNVLVRPHPIYSNREVVDELFSSNLDVEPDIYQSISKAKYVCSKYSSVLFIAYVNGIDICYDDVSNPELAAYLKEAQYRFACDSELTRLSHILK